MRLGNAWLAALGVGLVSGCNLITGSDSFVIDGRKHSTANGATTGAGSGSGGNNGSGGGASNGAGGTPNLGDVTDATGVSITEIDFYQAVKSKVMSSGTAVSPSVRIVANRPALVRVWTTTSGKSGGHITGRLTFDGHPPIDVDATSAGTSNESNLSSTINFQVPAGDLTAGSGYKIELLEDRSTSSNPSSSAHFPASGSQALAMVNSFHVHVTIVPIQYGADGSNRLPNTTASQIQAYKDGFMAMYPATGADITVGAPMAWNQTVSANGTGWDTLLQAVADHRIQSGAAADEFYFGAFEPSSDVNSFCGGGCVAGLGYVGDPSSEQTRAAIGLGYGGDTSTYTALHEVGHNHGRQHSPCGGASSPDPAYPYPNGADGVWGYDSRTKQLQPPTNSDIMGYCDPKWISDYVYNDILSFKLALGGTSFVFPEATLNQPYDRVLVGADGKGTWLDPIVLPRPPLGGTTSVTIQTPNGPEDVEGHFYSYDHLPGGVLYVKHVASSPISALDAMLSTGRLHLLH